MVCQILSPPILLRFPVTSYGTVRVLAIQAKSLGILRSLFLNLSCNPYSSLLFEKIKGAIL